MPDFTVDLNQTAQTSDALSAAFTDLQDRLNGVRTQVQALLSEGFQTPTAQQAMQAKFDEFSKGFEQVTQSLQDMSQVLKTAGTSFQEADQQIASQFTATA
ncbi:WXG100 family type VII secretion target [Nonomuraea terrae]|nr:WXG100 family type VII secretion target [Nonomuraea terrae]